MNKTAIIIVTYNRCNLLSSLLKSIVGSHELPQFVIVVDNASIDQTAQILDDADSWFPPGVFIPHKLDANIGGSGGFNEGVRIAYDLGVDWFWLMDDDVEVLPEGLVHMKKWSGQFKCLHGRRYDYDGSDFFWQPVFNEWLALPLPYLKNPFSKKDFFLTNSGCFEGMFIHRDVVKEIGFPDPRFFITWDDAIYGWLASKYTDVAYVNDYVIKRARKQLQVNLFVRHLNGGSDLFRYHVIRNREYIKYYLRSKNSYHPIGFFLGSILNFTKEIFRMIVVERSLKGFGSILKGALAARKLKKQNNWQPMPKVTS